MPAGPRRSTFDVVVIGGGNAGLAAALSARETGRRVVVLEKAPRTRAGGNSFFTAGAIRTTHGGLVDLRPLLQFDDADLERLPRTDVSPYSADDFRDDMWRLTDGQTDPILAGVVVRESRPTITWMHTNGIRFRLLYERQSYVSNGRHAFWGGLAIGSVDGGRGLITQYLARLAQVGVDVLYEHAAVELVADDQAIVGVNCATPEGSAVFEARSVVLAAGGFEASPERRVAYLGPEWAQARVRGTSLNTGEVLMMAIDAGGQRHGDWAGCHAIAWDAAAPSTGDWERTNRLSRQGYPFGIVVNRDAQRFIDEGADFRSYTYARYGREILRQSGAIAYQLFDARTHPLLSVIDYGTAGASSARADSIPELATALGLDPARLEVTVRKFNAAVQAGDFDPTVRDGKGTTGLVPPKSNWALPLEVPPFYGYAVTCGITFTFGGVRVDREGRVLRADGEPIHGLYAAGEMVGGLFHENYPGGTGLTSGAVFGRLAGRAAAADAL
jgi:tricarballylate dehydrogenase